MGQFRRHNPDSIRAEQVIYSCHDKTLTNLARYQCRCAYWHQAQKTMEPMLH